MPQLTDQQKHGAIALYRQGLSYTEIADALGGHRTSYARLIKNYEATGDVERKVGSGRKRKTSEREDIHLATLVKRNRNISAMAAKAEIGREDLCDTTIRNRIRQVTGFDSEWTDRKPYINPSQMKIRLEWCKRYRNWTPEDWSRVLWSDESPFELRFKGKVRVWRLPNERYLPLALTPTVKHNVKINVWGCFSANGVGRLHVVDGIMDQYQYMDILDENLPPSAEAIFGDGAWIFQQDNDPKHTANRTKAFLNDLGMPVMEWPSQSPDLNPIENLWAILDRRAKERKPKNKEQLLSCLKESWQDISPTILANLCASMPHRIEAVIKSHGGPTKY